MNCMFKIFRFVTVQGNLNCVCLIDAAYSYYLVHEVSCPGSFLHVSSAMDKFAILIFELTHITFKKCIWESSNLIHVIDELSTKLRTFVSGLHFSKNSCNWVWSKQEMPDLLNSWKLKCQNKKLYLIFVDLSRLSMISF